MRLSGLSRIDPAAGADRRADRPAAAADRDEFAAAVRAGLTKHGQKELPSKYLYDPLGTALFETITLLPEYGLTRADDRVLRRCAPQVAAAFDAEVDIAEFGSGTGQKSRIIIEAVAALQESVDFYPIDVSAAALDACARELDGVARVSGLRATYLDGLRTIAEGRTNGNALLLLFLGSTIGNFERACARDFLVQVRAHLRAGDAMLIGADLVKPAAQLVAAYDDPTGVTACFNRNLLGRINRELDGGFDLRAFEHEARYNAVERRIEMHLRSAIQQEVSIGVPGFTVSFDAGETIWTESSHKFELAELDSMARAAGFHVYNTWTDDEWPFAESLWLAA